jgi:hypothetical protein
MVRSLIVLPTVLLALSMEVMDLKGLSLARSADGLPLLSEIATVAERTAEAPRLSSVCFSSRWIHPRDAKDPWDTFQVATAFHATDFVWVYTLDPPSVGRMKQLGGKVYLAINSLVPDEPGKNERLRGRVLDLDGNRVTAPWMRGWKGSYWGCANSPEYRQSYIAYANRAVDAGTDGLQMDDPPMNVAAVKWGGCFCPHCMAGFRQYVKSQAATADLAKWGIPPLDQFDYRDHLKARKAPVGDAFAQYDGGPLKRLFAAFQEESVRAFYREVRSMIDVHAGRHIVFSSNNYAGRWQFPYDLFEVGMAELPERDATPETLYQRFADARRQGKAQLFTLVPRSIDGSEVAMTRRAITMSYACGGHLIVPWDVYTGSDRPRYYGKPEQYSDLYKLVRDHSQLFDGYEDAAFVLPGMNDRRYAREGPMAVSDADNVAVVARAIPNKPGTPAVIHLIEWRDDPQPVTLTLLSRCFSREGVLSADLLQPGKPSVRLNPSTDAKHTVFQIPRLNPWGLLVVSAKP